MYKMRFKKKIMGWSWRQQTNKTKYSHTKKRKKRKKEKLYPLLQLLSRNANSGSSFERGFRLND